MSKEFDLTGKVAIAIDTSTATDYRSVNGTGSIMNNSSNTR
ncbi:hypothetical protein ABN584_24725 [Gloeocapsa sp. BRSZ]